MSRKKLQSSSPLLKVVADPDKSERRARIIEGNRKKLGSPPEHFDDSHVDVWERLSHIVARSIQLHEGDALFFEMFCNVYHDYLEVAEELRTSGRWYSTQSNHMANMDRQHPLVGILTTTEKSLLRMSEEFGLTPASRAKLKLPISKELEPGAQFFD